MRVDFTAKGLHICSTYVAAMHSLSPVRPRVPLLTGCRRLLQVVPPQPRLTGP